MCNFVFHLFIVDLSDHRDYFEDNGDVETSYRDSITVTFRDHTPGQTYTIGPEILTPIIVHNRNMLYPSRRLLVDGTELSCTWMTSVSGDIATTQCEAMLMLPSDATVTLTAEAYLPPDHVIRSAEITVEYSRICLFIS